MTYETRITSMHTLFPLGKTEFGVQIVVDSGPFKVVKANLNFTLDKLFEEINDAARYEVNQFIKEHEAALGLV